MRRTGVRSCIGAFKAAAEHLAQAPVPAAVPVAPEHPDPDREQARLARVPEQGEGQADSARPDLAQV